MIEQHISLKEFNTFGLEAKARFFYRVPDIAHMISLWKTSMLQLNSPLVLGGGSNMLLAGDYPGLVIKNEMMGRAILKEDAQSVWLKLAAGENWHECVLWTVDQGWGGIENLSLIPGCVGAAPIQNIGAYGVELEQVLQSVQAFDMLGGREVEFSHTDCRFGYRDSVFKHEGKGRYFVTAIVIKLSKNPVLNIAYGDIAAMLSEKGVVVPGVRDVSQAVIAIRSSKLPDPAEIGNSGSFFKNPVMGNTVFEHVQKMYPDVKSFPVGEGQTKVPAAWLIEKAGWKGYRRGDAGVHARQALVIVNYGNATGQELLQLAHDVQKDVMEKFGVKLEMEVNIIGNQ